MKRLKVNFGAYSDALRYRNAIKLGRFAGSNPRISRRVKDGKTFGWAVSYEK